MRARPIDQEVLSLVDDLLRGVEALPRLEVATGLPGDAQASGRRETVLRAVRTKILPELRFPGKLPVFVGVQGGANVGKSTIFNALAGQLLSPAVVQASATKHPLIFTHEVWRDALLDPETFPDLECRELQDPKELLVDAERTELLYLRFHRDASLESLGLIDSPDFDSALETNLEVARQVTALSDLTVFVTTAQKYRDRELVAHLNLLLKLKARVLVVFNMLDEDIVYNTLLEDLRSTVFPSGGDIPALRIPRSRAAHPEDELKDLLAGPVLEGLSGCDAPTVKPLLLGRTLGHTLDELEQLTRFFSEERDLKQRFEEVVKDELSRAVDSYAGAFNLALPEETLAMRKVVGLTELWPRLTLPESLESSSTPLQAISGVLRRAQRFVQRLLWRLVRTDEGSIDDTPEAVAEYAQVRNDADFELLFPRALSLRQAVETFFRDHERSSSLARELLRQSFSPADSREFQSRLREDFDGEVRARRSESGEEIAERVNGWIERSPLKRRLLSAGGIALKIGAGATLTWTVPPDGIFEVLNWLYFTVGYLLAAYGVAFAVSVALRRKHGFRRSRVDGARRVLERAIGEPTSERLAGILNDEDLARLEKTAAALRRKVPELAEAGAKT